MINLFDVFGNILLFNLMNSHCPEWSEARATWLQLWLTLTIAVIVPLFIFLYKQILHWTPQFKWYPNVDTVRSIGRIQISNSHKSNVVNNVRLCNPIYIVCPKDDKFIKEIKQNNFIRDDQIYSRRLKDIFNDKDFNRHTDYESFYNKANYSHLVVNNNEISSTPITFSQNELAEAFLRGQNTFNPNNNNLDYYKCRHLILIHCTNLNKNDLNKRHNNIFINHCHMLLIEENDESNYTQV